MALACEEADVLHDANCQGRAGEVLGAAVLHIGVHERVARSVISLANLAGCAGNRAKEEEEIQGLALFLERLLEIPRPGHLGKHGRLPGLEGHVDEVGVLDVRLGIILGDHSK